MKIPDSIPGVFYSEFRATGKGNYRYKAYNKKDELIADVTLPMWLSDQILELCSEAAEGGGNEVVESLRDILKIYPNPS